MSVISAIQDCDGETFKRYILHVWDRIIIHCPIQVHRELLHQWKWFSQWQAAPGFMWDSIGVFLELKELLILNHLNRHTHLQLNNVSSGAWSGVEIKLVPGITGTSTEWEQWTQILQSPVFSHIHRVSITLTHASQVQWLTKHTDQIKHIRHLYAHTSATLLSDPILMQRWLQGMINLTNLAINGQFFGVMYENIIQLPNLSCLSLFNLHEGVDVSRLNNLCTNGEQWRDLQFQGALKGMFKSQVLIDLLHAISHLQSLKLNQTYNITFTAHVWDHILATIGGLNELKSLSIEQGVVVSCYSAWSSLFTLSLSLSLRTLILTPNARWDLSDFSAAVNIVFLRVSCLELYTRTDKTYAEIVRIFPRVQQLHLTYLMNYRLSSGDDAYLNILQLQQLKYLQALRLNGCPMISSDYKNKWLYQKQLPQFFTLLDISVL